MQKIDFAYFVAPFFGWLVAQLIKNALRTPNESHGKYMKYLTSGEMPSAHTATVVALATVVFMRQGFNDLFAVVVIFSVITIYDALVARRSIGEQGMALMKLIEKSKVGKDFELPRVALGHKPLEVLVGFLIGIGVGVIVAILITI